MRENNPLIEVTYSHKNQPQTDEGERTQYAREVGHIRQEHLGDREQDDRQRRITECGQPGNNTCTQEACSIDKLDRRIGVPLGIACYAAT
jgi:hypothetical protein